MRIKTIALFFLLFVSAHLLMSGQSAGSITYSELKDTVNSDGLYSTLEVDELLIITDESSRLSKKGRKPLFLIHGWSFDGKPAPPGSGFWNNFKNYFLSDAELSENFKLYYVRYWSNHVPVNEIADELRVKIEEAGFHEEPIVLVGHSMGGLIARSYMNEQTFETGQAAGTRCGDLVDRLITLGSPHHGSPMANGPARDAKFSFDLRIFMSLVEAALFKDVKYTDVNRSDLRWDNYDNTFDYLVYPVEKNPWLENLNKETKYDNKLVCYTATVPGSTNLGLTTLEGQYAFGSYLINRGFGMENDGIVPIQSAGFEGHNVNRIRHFKNYNHADIVRGKTNKEELFDPLKSDLMEVKPLKLLWPNTQENLLVKHSQNYNITWEASSTASSINLYYSINGGTSFELIDEDIAASSVSYNWQVPQLNSYDCLIKIENVQNNFESSVSQVPFTIYYNQISITRPVFLEYFLRYENNTIEWDHEGLGNSVKISYTDNKSGVDIVIADNIPSQPGINSYTWEANGNLDPTNRAYLEFELKGLPELNGDVEDYIFSSDRFQVFGDPNIIVQSPRTNPLDYFGIAGEQLIVGSDNVILWRQEGLITYVEVFLCGADKQIISQIGTSSPEPGVDALRSLSWTVPDLPGDEYYFYIEAGSNANDITASSYSENSFRINHQAQIYSPSHNEEGVWLYPCFELISIENATHYEFSLKDNNSGSSTITWEFESEETAFCVAGTIENELIPGQEYTLTAWAWIQDIRTFTHSVDFTTVEMLPDDFEILSPHNEDSTEDESIDIAWSRSVGASSYNIEFFQEGSLIVNEESLGKADTVYNVDLSLFDYYTPIDVFITAENPFGSNSATVSFARKWKTGIDIFTNDQQQALFKCYPNPFSQFSTITFEFDVAYTGANVAIKLYDISGKEIALIAEGYFDEGVQSVDWKPEKTLKSGIYLALLETGSYSLTSKIYVE